MTKRLALRALAVIVGELIVAQDLARAQSPSSTIGNETLSRARPGLDATGLRLGTFRLFPTVRGSAGYDDNIYNVDRDIRKSAIFSLQPALQLRSDWSAHRLELDMRALFERYKNAASENNNQYAGTLSGKVDVTRAIRIDAEAHGRRAIEARGTAGDVLTRGEPVRFTTVGGGATATRDSGALVLQVGGSFDRLHYRDVRLGAVRVDQTYRDHRSSNARAQIGYHVVPGIIAFVSGARRWERYDDRAAATLLDSNEYTLLGGLRFGVTRLISGEIGGGYLHRKSRFQSFGSTSGFAYDGALIWNPTTLVTFTFRGRKSIEESPTLLASGILTNRLSAELDYEPLRNILINARYARDRENYRGIDRRDRRTEAHFATRYLVNRFAEIELGYDRRKQRGLGVAGRSYSGNEVRLAITVQR